MKEIQYVRDQLERRRKDWPQIAHDTELNLRTIYNVMNGHVQVKYVTVERLFDYFKARRGR